MIATKVERSAGPTTRDEVAPVAESSRDGGGFAAALSRAQDDVASRDVEVATDEDTAVEDPSTELAPFEALPTIETLSSFEMRTLDDAAMPESGPQISGAPMNDAIHTLPPPPTLPATVERSEPRAATSFSIEADDVTDEPAPVYTDALLAAFEAPALVVGAAVMQPVETIDGDVMVEGDAAITDDTAASVGSASIASSGAGQPTPAETTTHGTAAPSSAAIEATPLAVADAPTTNVDATSAALSPTDAALLDVGSGTAVEPQPLEPRAPSTESPAPSTQARATAEPAPASRAPIHIERIEDLTAAIDKLRPIPRGGAVIEVQTPGMGAVRLELAIDEGALRIRIDSADPATRAWIESEQQGIAAAARQAAPEAGSIELELRGGEREGRGRSSRGSKDGEPGTGTGTGTGTGARGDRAGGGGAPTPTTRRGLVDVVA